MIVSSRQVIIISSNQSKQIFLFDPKTSAILHKYRQDSHILPSLTYYPNSQQIIAQQQNKTFLSIWNWDNQQSELKVSLSQIMSFIKVSDNNLWLLGGTITGNLYIWDIPSGILIKKKALHSSQIKKIIQYKNNHLVTISKTQVKFWTLSSILIQQENTPSTKTYTSLLDIIGSDQARETLFILTNKSLTFLENPLNDDKKQFKIIHKIDFEYATCLTTSNMYCFVGDGKGLINIIQICQNNQKLIFNVNNSRIRLQRQKKIKTLQNPNSKSTISCLTFVQSLGYLIAGHSNGEIVIWNNGVIKKSMCLYQSNISSLTVIQKPKQNKILQDQKLKPLHKYEMSKQQQPLDIYHIVQNQYQQYNNNNQQRVLNNMLNQINDKSKDLKILLERTKQQKYKLIEANLHYFNYFKL